MMFDQFIFRRMVMIYKKSFCFMVTFFAAVIICIGFCGCANTKQSEQSVPESLLQENNSDAEIKHNNKNDAVKTDNASSTDMKEAYLKVLSEYEAKYGQADIGVNEEAYSKYMTGLFYAKQIDFNQDGTDELLLVYYTPGEKADWDTTTDSYKNEFPELFDRNYSFSVYSYSDGNAVPLFEKTGLGGKNSDEELVLTWYEGKYYVECRPQIEEHPDVDFSSFSYYYGFDDKGFGLLKSRVILESEENAANNRYYVDGQEYNSLEDANTACWDFNNDKTEPPNGQNNIYYYCVGSLDDDNYSNSYQLLELEKTRTNLQGDTPSIYQAYGEILKEYENIYGGTKKSWSIDHPRHHKIGQCAYVNMIDFNQDGTDELLIVYDTPYNHVSWTPEPKNNEDRWKDLTNDYSLAVFGYDGNSAIKLCEVNGVFYGMGDGENGIYVIPHDENYYIYCGMAGNLCEYGYYYGFDNGDFKLMHYEFIEDIDGEEWKDDFYAEIDGEKYTWEDWASGKSEKNRWNDWYSDVYDDDLTNGFYYSLGFSGGDSYNVDGQKYDVQEIRDRLFGPDNNNLGSEMALATENGVISCGAGFDHSAVVINGDVYIWGDNYYGQLGDGTKEERIKPAKVEGLPKIKSVALGSNCSAAISVEGDLYTWGSNYNGILGDGTTETKTTPEKVENISNVCQVDFGGDRCIALTEDGDVYTWGNGNCLPEIVTGISNVKYVAVGESGYFAAITDAGDLYTWGNSWMSNEHGELGVGSKKPCLSPTKVENLKNVVSVSLGYEYTGAVTEDGCVYTWGYGDYGQVGDDSNSEEYAPALVPELKNIQKVVFGEEHYAAIDKEGYLYTWGNNKYGQLGNGHADGNDLVETSPIKVADVSNVRDISLGQEHSVMITNDNQVFTFGDNMRGQLGDDSLFYAKVPLEINIISK